MVSTIMGHCSEPVDQHTRNNSVIVKISAIDKQIWHYVGPISLKRIGRGNIIGVRQMQTTDLQTGS